jgi:hypothetical protein
VWVAAFVVAAAAVLWRLAPLPDARDRTEAVEAGPGRKLEAIPLAPWEAEYFGRARALRWLATGRGRPVVVTVVDGGGNRRAVHDPGYCFRGAGWTVVSEEPLALPHGEAVRVRLQKAGEELDAVYWFSDGRRAHASPTRYWWDTTRRRLTLGASGPEPVLVLLVPAQGGAVSWPEWLDKWPQFTRL